MHLVALPYACLIPAAGLYHNVDLELILKGENDANGPAAVLLSLSHHIGLDLAGGGHSEVGVPHHVHNNPVLKVSPTALYRAPPPGRGIARNGAAESSVSLGSVVRTDDSEIRWGSFVSQLTVMEAAIDEAVSTILGSIGTDAAPELALVFVASSVHGDFDSVVPLLRKRLPSLKHVFGCSGYGVVGGSSSGPKEVLMEPGFSLTLGQLPGVEIQTLHTLRSGIPKGNDGAPWERFTGVPTGTDRSVSFVLLADPRFQQIRDLVRGLDMWYPDAPKIGSLLSAGPQSKARAMFAWSATRGDIQMSSSSSSDESDEEEEGQSPAQARAEPKGFLQSIAGFFNRMAASTDGETASSRRDGSTTASSSSMPDAEPDNGTYLHGAVALVLHGNVVLDTIVSRVVLGAALVRAVTGGRGMRIVVMGAQQGYRSPSRKMYRIEELQASNAISTISRDSVYLSNGSGLPGSSNSSSSSRSNSTNGGTGGISGTSKGAGSSTTGSGLLPRGRSGDSRDSSDSDDEFDPDGLDDGAMPAVAAIVELMDACRDEKGLRDKSADRDMEQLLSTAVVAVAEDSGKSTEELGLDDFKLLHLEEVVEDFGLLVVDGEVQKGHRICIMIQDQQGIREDLCAGLLAYKRRDLQAMMNGRALPLTFGVLMFTDMSRGSSVYSEENFESTTIAGYLPVPASGMFGGAQIGHAKGSTSMTEHSCVIGVLRASGQRQAPAQEWLLTASVEDGGQVPSSAPGQNSSTADSSTARGGSMGAAGEGSAAAKE